MTIKEKILKIMSLALEINPPEIEDIGIKRTAVFINWYPSCNILDIKVYYRGWRNCAKSDESITLYTDWENASERLDAAIEMLETIKTDLENNHE